MIVLCRCSDYDGYVLLGCVCSGWDECALCNAFAHVIDLTRIDMLIFMLMLKLGNAHALVNHS